MFYKNVLAVALIAQSLSIYATSTTQESQNTHVQVVVTQLPTEQKQEAPEVRTYVSPSVETLQADKEFCLKTLSDETADINALSPSGKTTLQLLTLYFINNFTTEQLIAHALKRGADANVRDELERTPLFFVTAYALCPEVFAEKQAALDDSLASSAKASEDLATDKRGIANKEDITVEKTDEKAAEVSTQKTFRNPLHDRTLSLAVVELLLAFSADPTVTDTDGMSPLLLAVSTGDKEMVELFARYGLMERIFQESSENKMEATAEEPTNEVVAA